MEKMLKSSRITFLLSVLAVLVALCVTTLYKLQLVGDDDYSAAATTASVASTQTVSAARGSILDRNGVLLVSDRTVYNVKISRSTLLKQEDPNDIVLRLVKAAMRFDVDYTDTFPVTMSAPFAFSAKASTSQMNALADYLAYPAFELSEDISAPELITWMRDHYGISYTVTAEDARLIIGVRYELELRVIRNMSDYTFASDVNTDFITYIKEQRFPSVTIETSSQRQYHTSSAAHVLGQLGYIDPDDFPDYEEQGYTLNSLVGKNGAEYAFEEYLRGRDGSVTTYTDSSGAVTDVVVNSEAQAGSNVYLTIDIALTEVAEDSLSSTIQAMNAEREEQAEQEGGQAQEAAEGGAVVVRDVKSGEVLVLTSYPSFDPSTYNSNYSSLVEDPLKPLWNRATQGTYNPGSTFKMVTALAALRTGTITPYTTVTDEGKFTKYDDFQPTCWVYPSNHGTLNVVGAIENSCNYFFYWVADKMGITPIAEAASDFGLGSKTGIEIGESVGAVASREYKRETLDEGWWDADTLLACIGQGLNEFTPVQIASYVSTVANGGTVYRSTLLKYITSSDYTDVLLEKEPDVLNVIDDTDGYFQVLQRGMRAVVTSGTASAAFQGFPIAVAAKTGTVQSDNAAMNTGVFVCYAPADDPEIAIAIVIEKGGSGSALTTIAKDILTAYFSQSEINETEGLENTLIR